MKLTRIPSTIALIASASVLSLRLSAAPDAGELAKKAEVSMKSVITGSKTYQASLELSQSAGKSGSLTLGIDVKSVPSQGKMYIKMAPVGQPTGQMAMFAMMANMMMVDDGKTAYAYMAMQGGYAKRPHQKVDIPDFFKAVGIRDPVFKYIKSDHLNGKAVHVIQATPKSPGKDSAQTAVIYLDQATNRPVQVVQTGTTPSPNGGPPASYERKIVVKKELVNAAIPESAFKFVPPAGAKELKDTGSMPQNPFGMLGGGGRGPRP